jgi:hypothetical protein
VIVTDEKRIAHLEHKVDSLDRCVADLRRSVEALNRIVDENRIEHMRFAAAARSSAVGENG